MKTKNKLCECGCGNPVTKSGNRFINGHNGRMQTSKPKPESKLCACGCGKYAKPGNRFINGHNGRSKLYWDKQQEPKLCECGCGEYTKPGNRFINGHTFKDKKHSDKTRSRISEMTIKRYEDPLEREKTSKGGIERYKNPLERERTSQQISKTGLKRFEDPLEREKLSKAQLKRYENPSEREKHSAAMQHIPYDEWEGFASEQKYCPDYNEICKESNREKYGRRCFLCGLPEEENKYKNGKQIKLSVHHVDMNKQQGCNGVRWKLVPLSLKWHGKIHNELWEARITWLLDNVWN